jgi:hypothetical protein
MVSTMYVNIIIKKNNKIKTTTTKNKKVKQRKTKQVQKYYTVGTVPNSNR